jgi:hypothetical protein
MQSPDWHASRVVQALPSSHVVPSSGAESKTQPVAGLHESWVQDLPSSQVRCEPAHLPPEHRSVTVQALPSLQLLPLAAAASKTQPLAGLHESAVHGSWSLHVIALPPH